MSDNLAIIPARGGSKRIASKNLRQLGGLSLLARAIRTCQWAGREVVVSSEDAQIGAEAERYGARWLVRPAHLAIDEASSWAVLRHALDQLEPAGPVIFAQCTNPFLHPADIRGVLDVLPTGDLAVCVQRWHGLLVTMHGRPVNWQIDRIRSQDQPPQFQIVGSVWAFLPAYARTCEQYEGRVVLHEGASPVQIDIDTEDDLTMAAMLAPQYSPEYTAGMDYA